MSGMELGLAIVEGAVLVGKAVALIDKINTNIGVNETNQSFATSLLRTVNIVQTFFVSKQNLDDWELKGMSPDWQHEIPLAVADLKQCTEELEVVAGTTRGKNIHKRVTGRIRAVMNADTTAQKLQLIDVKLSTTVSRLRSLRAEDRIILQLGDRIAAEVMRHRTFQESHGHGQSDAVISLLQKELPQLPSTATGIAVQPDDATFLDSSPGASGSGAVVPGPQHAPSPPVQGRHVYEVGVTNFEEARRSVEASFPQVATFLRRLESKQIGLTLSDQEYDSLKNVFHNLWAPWQIDSSLLEPVGHPWPKVLGRGAFGTVYAYKLRTQKGFAKVAVKVISRDLSTKEFHSDFFREASLCYRLCHPSIVKFIGAQFPALPGMVEDGSIGGGASTAPEAGSAGNRSSESADDDSDDGSDDGPGAGANAATSEVRLIFERMDGDLASMTRAGKISRPEHVLRALANAAEGLAYMHEQGILHLDVKPENILVRTYGGGLLGRAKLTDFGVSLHKRERMTQMTTMRNQSSVRPKAVGTPAFMAPELQAPVGTTRGTPGVWGFWNSLFGKGSSSSQHRSISPASDVYSLGVTLAAAWSPFVEGGGVPPPACFAGGQEAVREAAKTGVLSQQVAGWMRKVFRDHAALLKVASACTRLRAEERPRMAGVRSALEALGKGEEVDAVWLKPAPTVPPSSQAPFQQPPTSPPSRTPSQRPAPPLAPEMSAAAAASSTPSPHASILAERDRKRASELAPEPSADSGSEAYDAARKFDTKVYSEAGVVKDDAKAAELYKIAVGKGSADAMCSLAGMYRGGRGVEMDYAEAVRLYKLAVGKGSADAMFRLAEMYRCGHGVGKDEAEAVRLYKLAVGKGSADAMYTLAHMYQYGHGVERHEVEAVRLYRLAADGGHAYAMYDLGWLYENGFCGLRKSLSEAKKFYQRAADSGHISAEWRLKEAKFVDIRSS